MVACVFHQGGGLRNSCVASEMIGAVFSGVVDLKVLGEHFWIEVGCDLASTFFGSERDMTVDSRTGVKVSMRA